MASIWFKPENTSGYLESPVFHTNDDAGFYSTRNLYFYARIYLDSNEMSEVQTLLTVLGDHDTDFSNYVARSHVWLQDGILNIYNRVYETGRAHGYLSVPIPTDEVVEIAATFTHGRNNSQENILLYVNGVLEADTQFTNTSMYTFWTHSKILVGYNNFTDYCRGLAILDLVIANDWFSSATPPVESGPVTTGNIIIPGNGNITRVQGAIKEDDQPVARRIYAITQADLEVVDSNERRHAVLSSVISDEISGSYSLDTSPYEGEVLVLAMDDFGEVWQADTVHAVGDVIRPHTFQGYVYLCISAGTTDSIEPTWWFDTEQSYAIGTALFKAKPYSRPLAHGPIIPEIIPEN